MIRVPVARVVVTVVGVRVVAGGAVIAAWSACGPQPLRARQTPSPMSVMNALSNIVSPLRVGVFK